MHQYALIKSTKKFCGPLEKTEKNNIEAVGESIILYLGRAAACDCGTPWTFLVPFLQHYNIRLLAPV